MSRQWEPVIGLEIHAQLACKSKIFSTAATAYGAPPNTQTVALDLGMPGTLPVLNEMAVKMAVKFGLAVQAEVAPVSIFARKNYFYPDLPKGYQISQYELPIVGRGQIDIDLPDDTTKTIGITRAHLEEDAGKSLHEDFHGRTGVDLNRAGTPLLEIVSEPDMRSAAEAVAYMRKIHTLVRYLEICDGNMQEGSFRCDANVSIRPVGQEAFGTRAELKNINSFRFVERAIEYEIHRQIHLLESGGEVVQETRLYDSDRNETRSMRSKEDANDYRYFPDPDLLPVAVDETTIEAMRQTLPELPDARKARYMTELGLGSSEAVQLTASRDLADFFEAVLGHGAGSAKKCANWVLGEFMGALNKAGLGLAESPVSASQLGELLAMMDVGTISGRAAKQVFEAMFAGEGSAADIVKARGLEQVSDTGALTQVVQEIIDASPSQVAQYQGGDGKVLNYFVGQAMKATKGKANPGEVKKLLTELLGS